MKKLVSYIVIIFLTTFVIKGFIFEIYSIHSGSMENALYPGDKIFVNKLGYSLRFLLDDFGQIKYGDVIVFDKPGKIDEFLIKRCAALPGDSLQIINCNLYINNRKKVLSESIKSAYKVYYRDRSCFFKQLDSLKNIRKSDLNQLECDFFYSLLDREDNNSHQNNRVLFFVYYMTIKQKRSIENLSTVDSVNIHIRNSENFASIFPQDSAYTWSENNFGLVVIPRKEMEIILNNKNYILYGSTIQNYEKVDIMKTDSGFYHRDKLIQTYCFKQDYYFMLGDSRYNSLDSRCFGFVPESYIIGKASRVLFSKKPYDKIRWNRIFKKIK